MEIYDRCLTSPPHSNAEKTRVAVRGAPRWHIPRYRWRMADEYCVLAKHLIFHVLQVARLPIARRALAHCLANWRNAKSHNLLSHIRAPRFTLHSKKTCVARPAGILHVIDSDGWSAGEDVLSHRITYRSHLHDTLYRTRLQPSILQNFHFWIARRGHVHPAHVHAHDASPVVPCRTTTMRLWRTRSVNALTFEPPSRSRPRPGMRGLPKLDVRTHTRRPVTPS